MHWPKSHSKVPTVKYFLKKVLAALEAMRPGSIYVYRRSKFPLRPPVSPEVHMQSKPWLIIFAEKLTTHSSICYHKTTWRILTDIQAFLKHPWIKWYVLPRIRAWVHECIKVLTFEESCVSFEAKQQCEQSVNMLHLFNIQSGGNVNLLLRFEIFTNLLHLEIHFASIEADSYALKKTYSSKSSSSPQPP